MKKQTSLFKIRGIWLLLLALLVIIVAYFSSGCTTTKDVTKQAEETNVSKEEDLQRQLADSSLMLAHLRQEIKEMQFGSVSFDKKCDTVINQVVEEIIKSDCPPERIAEFVQQLNAMRSKVKLYADGAVEAEGFLSAANMARMRTEQNNLQLKQQNNILLTENSQLKEQLNKKTESKEVHKKSGFLTGWTLYILIAIVCLIAGAMLYARLGKKAMLLR